jgi:hypothetical protein
MKIGVEDCCDGVSKREGNDADSGVVVTNEKNNSQS